MSQIHWLNDASGDFATSTNWTGGTVPGSGDDVFLDPTGTNPFTVTVTGTLGERTVSNLTLDASATLEIDLQPQNVYLTLEFDVSGSLANSGHILVDDNQNIATTGAINNAGVIAVGAVQNATAFAALGTSTLSGGGTLLLAGRSQQATGHQAEFLSFLDIGVSLTNLDNTVSGGGVIAANIPGLHVAGPASFTNAAHGVVDATDSLGLLLDNSYLTTVNAGLMEATGSGYLLFGENAVGVYAEGTITNTGSILGGRVEMYLDRVTNTAGGLISGSNVQLYLDTIVNFGGTITAAGFGGKATLKGTNIYGGSVLTSGGGLIVAGDVASVLDGTANAITLGAVAIADGDNITLRGAIHNTGQISLSSTGHDTRLEIQGASVTLAGGGAVVLSNNGYNSLDMVTNGGKLANVSSVIEGAGLIGSGPGGGTGLRITNQASGLIIASGAIYSLDIDAAGGTVINRGTLEATGAGGLVVAHSSLINTGGTIIAEGGSGVYLQSASVRGGKVSTAGGGAIHIEDGCSLSIAGTVVNAGTLSLEGSSSTTRLLLAASSVLSGGGTLVVNGGVDNSIASVGATRVLTNSGGLIDGEGTLFAGNVRFINRGTVKADGSTALTISTPGLTLTNGGTLEGTGAGGLVVSDSTIANVGGMIESAAGSSVTLNGCTVTSGRMTALAGSYLALNTSAVSGAVVATYAGGTLEIGDDSSLSLRGVVKNAGIIGLGSLGSPTTLMLTANTWLTGGGSVILGGGAGDTFKGAAPGIVLNNGGNCTLSGAGNLFAGDIHLVNDGVVAGTSSGLTLSTPGYAITNNGRLEALSRLVISDSTINGTGEIFAYEGATVSLIDVRVTGGTLATHPPAGLSGSVIDIGDGSTVSVSGAMSNDGTIALSSSGAGASLTLRSGSSIGGVKGSLISADTGTRVTFQATSISDQTLQTTGGGQMVMTLAGNALNNVTMSGTLAVSNGATVTLEGSLSGTGAISLGGVSRTTEAIVGNGPMGVTLKSGLTLALSDNAHNEVTGVQVGPSWTKLTIASGGTVSGSGSLGLGQMQLLIQSGGVVDAAGAKVALTVDTGATTIMNSGTIEASGAAGGLVKSAVSGGVLACAGGTLTLLGAVGGSGQVNGGALDFEGSFNGAVSFTGTAGTLILAHAQSYGGSLSGFSTSGGEFLDLKDIGFVSPTEAVYAFLGKSKGTLTVNDGAHSAVIHLNGDYTGSTFVCSSDGHGGVLITDPPAGAGAASPQLVVQAMARFALTPAPAGATSPAGVGQQGSALLAPHS